MLNLSYNYSYSLECNLSYYASLEWALFFVHLKANKVRDDVKEYLRVLAQMRERLIEALGVEWSNHLGGPII